MVNKKIQKLSTLFIFFFIFIAFKTDYRITNELLCCGDDFDYYSHAYTIAVDFDFDYSNQLIEGHSETFFYNGKIAPLGFVGSGILASPLLLIGNILDQLNANSTIPNKTLFYSLSPVIYLFISIKLLYSTLLKLDKNPNLLFITLLIFGSGVSYYAFERFSMTHVYEIFTISLILYITTLILKNHKNRNFIIMLLPFTISISFLVRYTNYYILLLPYILKKLFFDNKTKMFVKSDFKALIISSIFSSYVFFFITKNVYGIFTLNPTTLYMNESILNSYFARTNNFFDFFMFNLKSMLIVFFSQEFGIFWFSSIISFGLFSVIFSIKKHGIYLSLALLICFLQNFVVVVMWQSSASSYGYRYLFSLIPLSIIIFYSLENSFFKKFSIFYLSIFSLFGVLSVLFFESTLETQLSTTKVVNSFGKNILYSNPDYLSGVLNSFFSLEGYINLVGNSLLLASILKLLLYFNLEVTFVNLLSIDLPEKFQTYLFLLEGINLLNYIIFLFFLVWPILKIINFKKDYFKVNFFDQL